MRILDVGKMFDFPCAEPLFDPWKPEVVTFERDCKVKQDDLKNIDLIIFGGGQDVCPALYDHKNVASHCGEQPSARDLWERDLFELNYSTKHVVPMLGICRGAQFLCAMTGGYLIQHVDNHAGVEHIIKLCDGTDNDKEIVGNSYHHQMMIPVINSCILGYTKNRSKDWYYDTISAQKYNRLTHFNPAINAEIVLFNANAIGFQPHPEYLNPMEPFAVKTRKYVNRFFKIGENR